MPLYSWRPERRATRGCIKHFIQIALCERNVIGAKDDAWYKSASDVSRRWRDDVREQSIKTRARSALEYARVRASLPGHYPHFKTPDQRRWDAANV